MANARRTSATENAKHIRVERAYLGGSVKIQVLRMPPETPHCELSKIRISRKMHRRTHNEDYSQSGRAFIMRGKIAADAASDAIHSTEGAEVYFAVQALMAGGTPYAPTACRKRAK